MAKQIVDSAAEEKAITYKHIAEPLTAEQIRKGVGVTPEEAAYVRKVLKKLGYLGEGEHPERVTSSKPRTSKKSREQTDQ